jgi:hypothetical protein
VVSFEGNRTRLARLLAVSHESQSRIYLAACGVAKNPGLVDLQPIRDSNGCRGFPVPWTRPSHEGDEIKMGKQESLSPMTGLLVGEHHCL